MAAHSSGDTTTLVYSVPRVREGWELYEGKVSESELHGDIIDLLRQSLDPWARRAGARTARNLAVRWIPENPRVGIDPDLSVLLPSPDEAPLSSIRTWRPGHAPPALAIEIVSWKDPKKDYESSPDKCAAAGIPELVVFDPLLRGPKSLGGPFLLQVWRRDEAGRFARVYTGEGPAYSLTLNAYFVPTEQHQRLRIANDAAGTDVWPTDAEASRAEAAASRAEAAASRAEVEATRARIAELEAELARRER